MIRQSVRVALLLLLYTCVSGCAPDEHIVEVRLANLPLDRQRVRLSTWLSPEQSYRVRDVAVREDRFGIRIQQGDQGRLRIRIDVFASKRCLLDEGEVEVPVTQDAVTIAFSRVRPSSTHCLVRGETVGSEGSAVRIRSLGNGVVSEGEGWFDQDKPVELEALEGPGSNFTGFWAVTDEDQLPSDISMGSWIDPSQRSSTNPLLLMVGVDPPVVQARFEPPPCSDDGVCWRYPSAQGELITQIFQVPGGDLLAAAQGGRVLRWVAAEQRWAPLPGVPQFPGYLTAGWARGPRDIWIAGWMRDLTPVDGLALGRDVGHILHFDGERWTVHKQPGWGRINAIWGNGEELWFVGGRADLMGEHAFVLRLREDLGWAEVPVGCCGALYGVWGDARGGLWMVGKEGLTWTARSTGVVVYRTGPRQELRLLKTPSELRAVSGVDAEVFIAGEDGYAARLDTGLPRELTRRAPDSATLYSISARAAKDVYLVGQAGTVLHWDGAVLNRESDAQGANAVSFYSAMTDPGGAAWIAGERGLILRKDPGVVQWRRTAGQLGASLELLSLWGAGARQGFAVGSRGALLRWDGASWAPPPESHDIRDNLSRVWGADADHAWAVGTAADTGNASIWHLDPQRRWSRQSVADVSGGLSAVWGLGPRQVWASGQGVILFFNGEGWQRVYPPQGGGGRPINALWGTSKDDLWALGHTGLLWHCTRACDSEQGQWDNDNGLVPLFGQLTMNAIAGSAADDVWVAGERGTIAHYDGARWRSCALPRGQAPALYAIAPRGRGDVFFAGQLGALLHFDGRGLWALRSGTATSLRGIWLDLPDTLWLASGPADHLGDHEILSSGSGGGILRRDALSSLVKRADAAYLATCAP